MAAVLEYLAGAPAIIVVLLKVTLLLAAAWTVHGALGRANPRWRVWLWRTTIVGLALPAVWACGLPGWNWTVATTHAAIVDENGEGRVARSTPLEQPRGLPLVNGMPFAPTTDVSRFVDAPAHTEVGSRPVVASSGHAPGAVPSREGFATSPLHGYWNVWLPVTWLAVALLLFGRLIVQVWAIARMVRRSTPASESIQRSLAVLAAEFGMSRRVDVRESVEIHSPLLTGLLRPVIVLPRTLARDSDAGAIRMMLGHELAHVAGRDLWWTLCLRCVSIALWFHPLMWRAGRAHRLACETVSDGIAAGQSDRQQYVQLLARLALGARRRPAWEGGVAMLATSEISQRLRRLDRPLAVGRLSLRVRSFGVIAMTLLLALVAAVQFTSADATAPPTGSESQSQAQPSDDKGSVENAPVPAPSPPDLDAIREAQVEAAKALVAAKARVKVLTAQVPASAAARRGLKYLASIQREDGAFVVRGNDEPRVGLTAICALAMYRAAQVAEVDTLDRVDIALDYILSTQDENGYFKGPGATMYDHGFATWLLGELHGSDRWCDKVRTPLARAATLIQETQHDDGGWGYLPKNEARADVSQTACQLRALAAARGCGVAVSDEIIDKGISYCATCESASGGFSYEPGQGPGSFSRTAATLSAVRVVRDNGSELQERASAVLVAYLDDSRKVEQTWRLYGYFFAAEALRLAKDERQQEWLASIRKELTDGQHMDNGSWNDVDPVGPAFSTALAILILLPDDTPVPGPEPGGAPNKEKPAGAKEGAAAAPPMPTVPMLTATVHVTDQQGRPVAGAVVKPFGLRCRREPASHYSWNDKTFGPAPSVTTDADGIARVPCPKYV